MLRTHDAKPYKKENCGFRSLARSDRKPQNVRPKLLGHFVLDDCELAAIVAASGANRVVDVESTAVSALGERRSYGLVMGATLEGAGLGLSSFRMCHGVICLLYLFRLESKRASRRASRELPTTFTARLGEPRHTVAIGYRDDASRLIIGGILLGGEAVEHIGVAFRAAMHALGREVQENALHQFPCHVEVDLREGNDDEIDIGTVVVVIAHLHRFVDFHGNLHGMKTTIAGHMHAPATAKTNGIGVAGIAVHTHLHLQLATQYFRLLTVGEKSIVDYEIANPVGSICFAKWYYEFVSVGHNRLQSYIFSVNSNTLRPQNVGAKVVFSGFSGCFTHSGLDFALHLAECEQRIDAAGGKIGNPPAQVLMRREEQAKGGGENRWTFAKK